MNPSNRDGWHPSNSGPSHMDGHRGGDSNRPPGQPNSYGPISASHQQPQPGAPVLPPPPGPFYSSGAPSGPGIPPIAGMPQSSPNPPPHRHSISSQDRSMASGGQPPMGAYTMQGMPQSGQGQPLPPHQGFDREREVLEARDREMRDREYEQQARQQRDARDREMRERARDPGPPHQSHAEPLQLHQPVAVGPQVRSAIHNGLLGNPGPSGISGNPALVPNGHIPLFGPHFENPPRGAMPQSSQPMPTNGTAFGNMPPASIAALGHGQQPILNDALSYLDQVKVQFAGEPNVYNQFLDIMKDFKSQAIDTPGVIRRVSSLFAGNPNLIQGFNTFLPPGYRIECGTADDPNAIRVTTPMGSQVSPMGSTLRPLSNPRPVPNDINSQVPPMYDLPGRANDAAWRRRSSDQADGLFSPATSRGQPPPSSRFPNQLGTNQAPLSPPDIPMHREHSSATASGQMLAHQQEQKAVTQLQNAASLAAGESMGQGGMPLSPGLDPTSPLGENSTAAQAAAAANEKRGPVEFNHAISYVNKIKNRYSGQPEIYKQFLEILQTYQRESKPIQDVYAQVTQLFSDAPDLLQDFKQFLPESAAHAKAVAARQAAEDSIMTSNVRGDAGYGNQPQPHQTPRPEQHRLPPVGKFAPTPSAGRDVKRKRGDRAGSVVGPQASVPGLSTEVNGSGTGARGGLGSNKRTKPLQQQPQSARPAVAQQDALEVEPTLVPALPVPLPPNTTTTAASPDELAFFDRVKKFVANKNTMSEFLKLCNLYSQDLIDKNSLVYRVQNFIGGNPDLFNWFKGFVDYDGKDQIIENRAKPPSGRVILNHCRALGPSYRLLPKKERSRKCSGRDELCHGVLNDDWASHPTWASEDSGFIAHRKNMYEEHLHRIEEERHDYDHHIAVLERSVQLLSPIVQQRQMMTDAEATQWKLPRDFAGQSQSILKRALAKVYNRENMQVVMTEMIDRPAVVVPVLLLRFKHKLEEWKASQREWEKIWRDATQKFFWKSLDHQGINAKMADKRQFQTKTLQNEIQVKYEEQKRQRLVLHSNVPPYQVLYSFSDIDVLMDASRLLLTYAEHTHSTDFPRLTVFIKEFIPLFFGLDVYVFQQRIKDIFDTTPSNEEMDEDTPASEDTSSARGRKPNGRKPDLLRDVLAKSRTKPGRNVKEGSVASGSRATTPEARSMDEDMLDASVELPDDEEKPKTWINHPVSGNSGQKLDKPYERTTFYLYANLPIYCFFRMFVILYERLNHLKLNEKEVHDSVRRAKSLKAAIDLKMMDKHPDNFFTDTSPTANYYSQMLLMLEEFLKGDGRMEMTHIEEVLRRYYLQTGWMLYSFDKMLSALVRFAISVLSNDNKEKSSEILQLFTKDRHKETTTVQEELNYRKQVEKYVKDGDVYRIAYNTLSLTSTIRILKPSETTFDPTSSGDPSADEALLNSEQRWTYYITSYVSLDPTEGIDRTKVERPIIFRHLRAFFRKSGVSNDVVIAIGNGIGVPATASTAAVPATNTVAAADAVISWLTERTGGVNSGNESDTTSTTGIFKAVELGSAGKRIERLISREALGLRISPTNYKIFWSVLDSEEWWLDAPEVRKDEIIPSTEDPSAVITAEEPTVETITASAADETMAENDAIAGADGKKDDNLVIGDVAALPTEATGVSAAQDVPIDATGIEPTLKQEDGTTAPAAADSTAIATTAAIVAAPLPLVSAITNAQDQPQASESQPQPPPLTQPQPQTQIASPPPPSSLTTTTTTTTIKPSLTTQHSTQHDEHDDTTTTFFEERFLMNNPWMAGLSRDDVDGRNREYRGWKEGGGGTMGMGMGVGMAMAMGGGVGEGREGAGAGAGVNAKGRRSLRMR